VAERDVRAAVFRPDDERIEAAVDLLESLGADPVPDPMLRVEPTGETPREDADYAILTASTGVAVAVDAGWDPGEAAVCAIGPTTAGALREAGYDVALVPDDHSSSGLVAALGGRVDGARVEIARSAHGSSVLPDGLDAAGAYVHETHLYELVRPEGAGHSAELAVDGLTDAVVGAIGDPTAETAREAGIAVDVVPEEADFEVLATTAVEAAAPTYRE
jgi:uroporphyrinogen-III synthase